MQELVDQHDVRWSRLQAEVGQTELVQRQGGKQEVDGRQDEHRVLKGERHHDLAVGEDQQAEELHRVHDLVGRGAAEQADVVIARGGRLGVVVALHEQHEHRAWGGDGDLEQLRPPAVGRLQRVGDLRREDHHYLGHHHRGVHHPGDVAERQDAQLGARVVRDQPFRRVGELSRAVAPLVVQVAVRDRQRADEQEQDDKVGGEPEVGLERVLGARDDVVVEHARLEDVHQHQADADQEVQHQLGRTLLLQVPSHGYWAGTRRKVCLIWELYAQFLHPQSLCMQNIVFACASVCAGAFRLGITD